MPRPDGKIPLESPVRLHPFIISYADYLMLKRHINTYCFSEEYVKPFEIVFAVIGKLKSLDEILGRLVLVSIVGPKDDENRLSKISVIRDLQGLICVSPRNVKKGTFEPVSKWETTMIDDEIGRPLVYLYMDQYMNHRAHTNGENFKKLLRPLERKRENVQHVEV